MAVNPVSLPDYLRPWHNAGLACLLAEDPVLPSLANPSPVRVETPAARPPRAIPAPRENQAAVINGNAPDGTERKNASLPENAVPQLPPPESWPENWQALFRRTKAAPLVWTYPELGLDLCGGSEESAERSGALKALIAALQLRKGSSAFWPFALPEGGAAADNPAVFQSGLARLDCRAIILFGPDSLARAGFNSLKAMPYQQSVVAGRLVIVLPSFASMLSDAGKKDTALAYLRSALSRLRLN